MIKSSKKAIVCLLFVYYLFIETCSPNIRKAANYTAAFCCYCSNLANIKLQSSLSTSLSPRSILIQKAKKFLKALDYTPKMVYYKDKLRDNK